MKPRNKYEQHIAELSEVLPPITQKQKEWAFANCFEKVGYASEHSVWCLECGKVFDRTNSPLLISVVGDEAICPHCGAKLRLENSKKRKFEERWYYTILTTFRGFQVCRHFIVSKKMWKVGNNIQGCERPTYTINEAVQNWIDEEGRETIMARPTNMVAQYYDLWDFKRPMSIKAGSSALQYVPQKYDIEAKFIYPIRRLLPIIKRNGYTGRFHGISASELFKMLLRDREAESLIKNHQYALLRHKWKTQVKEFGYQHEHSIRIAIKNKYIIKDASMWLDYLDLLDYFHKDTHNAFYVCPADLKTSHDKLLEKKCKVEEKIEREKNLKEAKKWEKVYLTEKGKFFGVCFGDNEIIISVIKSVAEMAEEGQRMHHCVYSMGYYKKPQSLILSAKNIKGDRLETIEVNLQTFKVVQSRAVCNGISKYHSEILNLVNKNMNLIKACA